MVRLSEEKIIQQCSTEFVRLLSPPIFRRPPPPPPHAPPTKTGIPRPLGRRGLAQPDPRVSGREETDGRGR